MTALVNKFEKVEKQIFTSKDVTVYLKEKKI